MAASPKWDRGRHEVWSPECLWAEFPMWDGRFDFTMFPQSSGGRFTANPACEYLDRTGEFIARIKDVRKYGFKRFRWTEESELRTISRAELNAAFRTVVGWREKVLHASFDLRIARRFQLCLPPEKRNNSLLDVAWRVNATVEEYQKRLFSLARTFSNYLDWLSDREFHGPIPMTWIPHTRPIDLATILDAANHPSPLDPVEENGTISDFPFRLAYAVRYGGDSFQLNTVVVAALEVRDRLLDGLGDGPPAAQSWLPWERRPMEERRRRYLPYTD